MAAESDKPQGLALASMILGIVGVVLSITPCTLFLGLIPDILAVVLGWTALQRIKANEAAGKNFATAGLWAGGIGIVLFLLAWIAMGQAINQASRDFDRDFQREMERMNREMDRFR